MIYIPPKIKEVNPGLTAEELDDYIDRVWGLLGSMKTGDTLIIDNVARKHPELFRECVKDYMKNHPWYGGISFNSRLESIRKDDLEFITR